MAKNSHFKYFNHMCIITFNAKIFYHVESVGVHQITCGVTFYVRQNNLFKTS